jgi:phosphoglycerate dehydrogenase-like enzyme
MVPSLLPVLLVGQPGERARSALHALETDRLASCVDVAAADRALRARAEVLFIWDFRWRSLDSLLPELPALRWIHLASAGVDHVLEPGLQLAGITVTNSGGVFDRPIAEYVLGLILAHAKGLVATIEAQRERRWAYRETLDVSGRLVVVVGLGRVGRAVGELARAAGLRVVGVRSQAAPVPRIDVVPREGLLEALHDADYVVVTAALTPETHGLIDRRAIASMKPSAFLINVARGPIVDTTALLDALGNGRIAGAALDVFETEPLPPDSPLWSAPNLLVSPHMAGDSDGWDSRVVELFGENVRRYLRGEPLRNVVDPARGY